MRKRFKGRKLSMKKGPRKALLRSLTNNFFLYEKIKTTEARAKELRPIAEKLITKAKKNNVANHRLLLKTLTPQLAKKLSWKKLHLTPADKYNFRGKYYKADFRLFEY